MELFSKAQALSIANRLSKLGPSPFFRPLQATAGTTVEFNGQRLLLLSTNDYLGLTHDARVIDASADALRHWGTGCAGSRLLSGNLALHETLERKLAEFFEMESAIVFATGFQAALGTLSALGGRGDFIFSDEANHASVIDGCRLSHATVKVYRHKDMEHLEALLTEVPLDAGKLVVSDGVFSTTGHLAAYDEIHALAKKYRARTYLDDAHGLGVLGKGGRGTASHFGLPADIIMGTFSKSLASQGGFVVTSRQIVEWLRYRARSFLFSDALAPASAAAALKALEILSETPGIVQKVNDNASYLKSGLHALGIETLQSATPISPVLIGDESTAFRVCGTLLTSGVFTTPMVYPAVPKGRALIRCSVMATHTKEDLDFALGAFAGVASTIVAANEANSNRTGA